MGRRLVFRAQPPESTNSSGAQPPQSSNSSRPWWSTALTFVGAGAAPVVLMLLGEGMQRITPARFQEILRPRFESWSKYMTGINNFLIVVCSVGFQSLSDSNSCCAKGYGVASQAFTCVSFGLMALYIIMVHFNRGIDLELDHVFGYSTCIVSTAQAAMAFWHVDQQVMISRLVLPVLSSIAEFGIRLHTLHRYNNNSLRQEVDQLSSRVNELNQHLDSRMSALKLESEFAINTALEKIRESLTNSLRDLQPAIEGLHRQINYLDSKIETLREETKQAVCRLRATTEQIKLDRRDYDKWLKSKITGNLLSLLEELKAHSELAMERTVLLESRGGERIGLRRRLHHPQPQY